MKNFFNKLIQYLALFKSMLIDSLWKFKWRAFLVLISGFLGVTFQVQAIGLAIYYARVMEKGGIVKLLGYEFQARTSLGLLSLSAFAVLASLILSAWLIYFFRAGSLSMSRRYQEFCIGRTLSVFGSSLRVWSPSGRAFGDDRMILRLIQGDARFCGRALSLLLLTIIPIITLIVAVAALFYLNVFLTFFILFLMGISAVFQYRVSIRGAKNYSLMEKHSKGASSEFRKIIQCLKGSANPLSTWSSWLDTVFTRGSIKRHLDAYEGHLKAIENSRLVNNILLAIAIFAILGTLGASIIKEGQGWGKLIIYLVALRYTLVNATSAIMRMTSLNRFYPQLRRYFQFLENTGAPLRSDKVRSEKYVISTQSDVIDGSLEQWTLYKGSRIGLVSPVELNRYTIAFLTDCLFGHAQEASRNALGSMCFVTSYYGILPMGLRESLGFPHGYDWKYLQKDMEESGLWDRIEKQLPHDLEKTISPDTWIKVDPDLKFTLALLTAVYSDALWVMLEEKGLLTLPEGARKFFLNRLSDRITVIVFNNEIAAVGNYNEEVFAVINENGIVGLGSAEWIKNNESTIKDILSRGSLRESRLGVLEDDQDEDLDDV